MARLQDRGPKVRLFHSPNSFALILTKNYDEGVRRADRDPHGILCSCADASAPQMQTAHTATVEPSGSSTLLLPAVGRALASMEGGGGSGLAPPRV